MNFVHRVREQWPIVQALGNFTILRQRNKQSGTQTDGSPFKQKSALQNCWETPRKCNNTQKVEMVADAHV